MTQTVVLMVSVQRETDMLYTYKAVIDRVVDADTVDATVDLGFSLTFKNRFRIKDYDAPETWKPRNEAEKTHGEQATIKAIELLQGKTVTLLSEKFPGIYGRYSARILLEGGTDYAIIMKSLGFEKLESY